MAERIEIGMEPEVVIGVGGKDTTFKLFEMVQKLRPIMDRFQAATDAAAQDAILPDIAAAFGIDGLKPLQGWQAAAGIFEAYAKLLVRKNG